MADQDSAASEEASAADPGRCTKQYAANAKQIAKCLSSLLRASLFIAGTVSASADKENIPAGKLAGALFFIDLTLN